MNTNMMGKISIGSLLVTMIAGVFLFQSSAIADESAIEAANNLASLGIIEDQSEDTKKYSLDSNITRREMLKVMMNLSDHNVGEVCTGKFSDLPSSDWGCKYAEAALSHGFIASNSRFRPDDLITETETLKMIMQARQIAAADGVEPWGEAYRQAAVAVGVLSSDTRVSGVNLAKRSFVFLTANDAIHIGLNPGEEENDEEIEPQQEDETGTGSTSTDSTSTGSTSTGSTSTGSTSTGSTSTGSTFTGTLFLPPLFIDWLENNSGALNQSGDVTSTGSTFSGYVIPPRLLDDGIFASGITLPQNVLDELRGVNTGVILTGTYIIPKLPKLPTPLPFQPIQPIQPIFDFK